MEDFDEARVPGPHGSPLIATLAGWGVLVAATLAVPRVLPPIALTTLLGAGFAAGLLLWIIAFAVTIRRASIGWKLGSLAVLIGAGLLSAYLIGRQYQALLRVDPSSFAEARFASDGTPSVAARGPLSERFMASVRAAAKEQRAYGAAFNAFGAGALSSPYLLEQNPKAIRDCDAIEQVRTLAKAQAAARAARNAELAQAIENAQLPADLREGIRTMMFPAGTDGQDAVLVNQLATLDATGEMCTLLAKRSWYNDNAYFGFTSGGDKARYDALAKRLLALTGEGEKLAKDATARMKQGQEMVRAALS